MGSFREHNRNQGSRNFGRDRGRSFSGRGGSGNGRGFGRGRDSGRDSEKFDVVCTECKKPCKVPFKPTGNKPVLCDDCFKGRRDFNDKGTGMNSSGRSNIEGVSKEQISQINNKLDKILNILENLEIETDEVLDEVSE